MRALGPSEGGAKRRSRSARDQRAPSLPARHELLPSLLVALVLSGLFACATRGPEEAPASEGIRPIDLSPRCIVFEPLAGTIAPLPNGARSRRLTPTLEAVVLPGPATSAPSAPASALHRLRWVTPVSAFPSAAHARAAFFVWSIGELSADPIALRQRLRARGIVLSTARRGDHVVLDLLFPASALEDALETGRTLMAPQAIAPGRLESIRRELALLLLAEEAAPKAAARRLRRSLRRGEPAPGAQAVLEALDEESLRELLVGALQGEPSKVGHLLVYSGAGQGMGAGTSFNPGSAARTEGGAQPEAIVAALDRLEEAVASWPGPWRSMASDPRPGRPARDVDPDRGAEDGAAATDGDPTRETAAEEAPVIHLLDQPGARQVELLASRATVGRGAADRPALEMLASLLGDPLGGRLFRDLRERQGLAYEIGAEQTAEGHFEVSTRTRPERLGALMAGIEAHQAALAREPIEDCELAMLRERMQGLLALEADEPGLRLDGLVRSWTGPGSPPGLAARAAAYQAVSRETLERVARRWLAGPIEWLLVGDASRVVGRLREAFPDRRILVHDASLETVREARREAPREAGDP